MKCVYVDADACPVRNEIMLIADRHTITVFIVSNRGFRTGDRPNVRNILVPETFDAADDWIAGKVEAGDIVVTGDIPLAHRVIGRGAKAIGHSGKQFTEAGIGMAMAMRDLMSDLRAMGDVSGGGPAFSRRDRETFIRELERLIRE